MPKVALDTNFLLLPFQLRVDIEEQLEELLPGADIYVPSSVIRELIGLSHGKMKRDAKLALELAKRYKVVKTEAGGDEALVELAEKDYVIATNDKLLKEKIRKMGKAVIFLRQEKLLNISGYGGI
ncbi:Fcf1 [archaeon BMS3Bbin15]|nr:Fcf1 [archaeon BMS3Bbin15]